MKYKVWMVVDSDGDKCGVYPTADQAREYVDRHRSYRRITQVTLETKQELEDVVEDNLTDQQAKEYETA